MNAKTVLVTGAAGIIGPSIVERLVLDGWNVAASDRSQEEFDINERIVGKPVGGHHFIAELSRRANCIELISKVEAALGPIHAIVNNATVNFNKNFDSIEEEMAQTEIAVNFLAPLWLTHAAKSSLKETKGCVINMSSVQVTKPFANSFIYTCTKAALENAINQLTGAFLEEGIRFNGIRIGMVPGFAFLRQTAMQLSRDDAARMASEILPKHLENSRLRSGEQLVGKPEEVADLVAFLLKPESRFLNGEIISLDGGFSKQPLRPRPSNGSKLPTELFDEWLAENKPSLVPPK